MNEVVTSLAAVVHWLSSPARDMQMTPRSYPTEEDRWLATLEELNLLDTSKSLGARASATSMVSAIEMQHMN